MSLFLKDEAYEQLVQMIDDGKFEYDKKYSNKSCYWRGKKVLDRNINIYLNHLKK